MTRPAKQQSWYTRHAGTINTWILWIIFIGGFVWLGLWDSNRVHHNQAEVTVAAWASWVEFRDKECQPYEKAYAVAERSGKFTNVQNIITYKCSDGILYSVSEQVEQAAEQCTVDQCNAVADQIPKRPD